jgi:ABC-type bacteriocin/lantibiotic exporter with double-glycine peptidase domain
VGHWLVVVGVTAEQIAVRDSSAYHIRTLAPSLFERLFTGIAVVVWHGPAPTLP